MAYWSIALLLLSVSFLAIRHPPEWENLPRGMRPARRRAGGQDGRETSRGPRNSARNIDDASESDMDIETEDLNGANISPKASATESDAAVPVFSLNDLSTPQETELISSKPGKVKADIRTITQSSGSLMMPPASKPSVASPQKPATNLMGPPPRPIPDLPNGGTTSLRIPSTGPLPKRGPPAHSQQRVSGGLSPNGVVATPNPRGKVLLSPGHSPMDWAALSRKGNLSGVSSFQRVTPSQLKAMTGRKGKPAWSVWQGKVYNITPYLPFHPGGEPEIMKAAGRDGTKLFMEVHPWVNWENMLGSCLVGVLVPEDYGASPLEDMD